MSTFDFRRIGMATTGPSVFAFFPKGIDYNDLERVDAVTTLTIAEAPFKIVSHSDIPKGELHMVQNGKCTGKIVNIE